MSMSGKSCAAIVFSRAPVPGQVKTRLIPRLGATGAAYLYRTLVRQTLARIAESAIAAGRLYCTPTLNDPFLARQARDFGLTLHLQSGCDLGERMYQALLETLRLYDTALLIGCDCPTLSADDLNLAFEKLTAGYECVIGPAEDGGYYLIGMHCADRRVFAGIDWEQGNVLLKTRKQMRKLNWKTYELAKRWDLDRAADLDRYVSL